MSDPEAGSTHLAKNVVESRPNIFVRFVRLVFGYRKTSLTLFVFLSVVATVLLSWYDNTLRYLVALPTTKLEKKVLDSSWLSLQEIARYPHTYTSEYNDYVHDLLEDEITQLIEGVDYAEYDNDLNYTNNVVFKTKYLNYDSVSYYESNNLVVRLNGTKPELPALLLSAHFDSVPSSYGVTDDGFGVATLLGLLEYFTAKGVAQPQRTIVFNFNNNEEFGLYGATAFLSHPWFKQVRYFLNLEGTGAGGKAVLFRGTDYGIIKYFKSVRYPHGTSLYQQGFNNHLIRSETDYKVYKEKGGIRGLDLAFYKPRDIYHTAGDNIKNVNSLSLWHMLSNSLDFANAIVQGPIDLDDEYLDSDSFNFNHEFSAYASFLNFFFAFPVSQVVLVNIVALIVVPVVSFPLLLFVVYRKNWDVNFLNFVKLPLSLAASVLVLNVFSSLVSTINEYLPNSSFNSVISLYFALFLLLNYLVLNGLNYLFRKYKGVNHDEKLVVIIETSFLYWVALLYSTVKLSKNKIGDDHTGEFPVLLLFLLQSLGAILGLVGWTFRKSAAKDDSPEAQPLLDSSSANYGSDAQPSHALTSSLLSEVSQSSFTKYFSYDWSLQFLLVVPLSSLIIFNSGELVLDGITKSIQESLKAEQLIYRFIKLFVVVWAIPFLPFIFKINRLVVIALVLLVLQGLFVVLFAEPFSLVNPLKLRFIQSIDLSATPYTNKVLVTGRDTSVVSDVLKDLPSFKSSGAELEIESLGDGVNRYSYDSALVPKIVPGYKVEDLLDIEVLKNSSSNTDYPFALLSGEIRINVPKNRNVKLNFNMSQAASKVALAKYTDTPVKTIIIYADDDVDNESLHGRSIPEGFSKDKHGNYIFKDLSGIDELQLNKLDWDKSYHIGFQWVPLVLDLDEDYAQVQLNKLGVKVQSYWSDLGFLAEKKQVKERIPAYDEVLHYSPNYISWANQDRGLVSVSKYLEI